MEGGRYGSVHGPSGMGFDLRSADRHRSYDGKTVGYGRLAKMAMAMAMALLRAAAMAADSADDGHSGRPAFACLLRAASAEACLQPLIKVGIPRSRSSYR